MPDLAPRPTPRGDPLTVLLIARMPPYCEDPVAYTCQVCRVDFTCHTACPAACPNCGRDYTAELRADAVPS